MKIYLIRSPEYSVEDFNEVFGLLSSFEGPISFVASSYEFDISKFYFLRYELYPQHNFKYESEFKKRHYKDELGFPLSWRELFSLCTYYRKTFKLDESDHVILLTLRKNALNWFSAFDNNKNAFVHCADWEFYINASHKFPVAYEIVANILRMLMKLPLELPNPYVHEEPLGCVNDLCMNKKDIVLKLRTADICNDCMSKINEEKVDVKLLHQTMDIFEGIRVQLLFRQGFKKQIIPVPIVVNEQNQLLLPSLGNLEIRLTPLFKALYIFYLIHTEGVRLADLNDFKVELLSIYRKLSVRDDDEVSKRSIDDLVDAFGNSFSQKKSKINSKITEILGEPLAHFYRIEGERGEPFKINLPSHLIDIRY